MFADFTVRAMIGSALTLLFGAMFAELSRYIGLVWLSGLFFGLLLEDCARYVRDGMAYVHEKASKKKKICME